MTTWKIVIDGIVTEIFYDDKCAYEFIEVQEFEERWDIKTGDLVIVNLSTRSPSYWEEDV